MSTSSPTKTTECPHIACTPGTLGGEPRVDGHRISVRHVVAARDVYRLSPEETVREHYPTLTLAEVYAALAYYEDHRAEIEALERTEDEFVERFVRENQHIVHDMRPGVSSHE